MSNFENYSVYSFFARLKFLLSATNQHGVHSPFIYQFVTKGLYKKGNKNYTKTQNVLFKCISYFKYSKIGLVNDSHELRLHLNSISNDLDYNDCPFDLIYADSTTKPFTNVSQKNIHNNSLLLIAGIYKNRQQTKRWEAIKDLAVVTVTIDLYYCGIVFFRKEQAKEHFKIRI